MSKFSRPVGLLRRLGRARDERGAYAILMSMTLVLVIALAAIAVDIASQVSAKQSLKDTMDAAAHAGAYVLPDQQMDAGRVVQEMASANDIGTSVNTDLWCVVASTGATKTPLFSQIPGTCKPHGARPYPGTVCDEALCFIPCRPSASDPSIKCNTIRVADSKVVPYAFAPAIGYKEGSTGAVVSVACKGSCGTEAPNPMDVALVADRTLSLSTGDRGDMKDAIKSMIKVMDPKMHFLAFGTIHKSEPTSACPSAAYNLSLGRNESLGTSHMDRGSWMPTNFSADYVRGEAGARTWNAADNVYKAINCLPSSDADFGTHLAAPLKAAARKLTVPAENNLGVLNAANPREGTPRKVIIFQTDGQPNEKVNSSSSTNITTAGDPRNTNGNTACTNLKNVATSAKNANILIITIGFGDANSAYCNGGNSGTTVRSVLAAAASPGNDGRPSEASTCSNSTQRNAENSDGDYYFCAVNGSEFQTIFATAFSQLTTGVRLVKFPG